MRFFDSYFAPSLSMIGWSIFVGPAARQRPQEELAESRRRVTFATLGLEEHLRGCPRDSVREALCTARTPHLEPQFAPGVEAARSG